VWITGAVVAAIWMVGTLMMRSGQRVSDI
jgi:hypothetical protein